MPKKRFSAEQVATLPRQIEVLMAQGKAASVACREAGISAAIVMVLLGTVQTGAPNGGVRLGEGVPARLIT